jgi:hypothetical protein
MPLFYVVVAATQAICGLVMFDSARTARKTHESIQTLHQEIKTS